MSEKNSANGVFDLAKNPLHLGLGARCSVQEAFTGSMEWYDGYSKRTAADGKEGRLVSMHGFAEPWDMWEMHPEGEELVLCLDGVITLHQESAEFKQTVTLLPGQGVVNPAGVWHTADVDGPARALFITAGVGTQHKPR